MTSNKKYARLAGLFYFIYFVTTIPSNVRRDAFVVLGDAATTAQNILASPWLFRLSFVGDLVSAVFFLLAAWALYALLKSVNKDLALLLLLLNLAGVAVYSVGLLSQFAVLLLLSGADYLGQFQPDQLQALAMFFLKLHENGYWMSQIFFGAWLFPLGYLVFKSGFLPRVLGIVLMVHCVGWLTTFLQFFLFPDLNVITYLTYPLGFVAELSLTLWLLIVGAKDRPPAIESASLKLEY